MAVFTVMKEYIAQCNSMACMSLIVVIKGCSGATPGQWLSREDSMLVLVSLGDLLLIK